MIHTPAPFIFQSMWTSHQGFLLFVSSVWSLNIYGTPIFCMVAKFKMVKHALCVWNKSIFWNLSFNIKQSQARLQEIQDCIAFEGFSYDNFQEEMESLAALDSLLLHHNLCLRDKCHVKWLSDWDRNTSCFYSLLRSRKARKPLAYLLIGNSLVSDLDTY